MNTFGNRLKLLRTEKKMTQKELAAIFGATNSAVNSYETRNRFVSESLLKQYAEYFGVSTDYLLGVSDIRNPVTKGTKSFAEKLVKKMIDENMITDKNDIDPNLIDTLIAAIKFDVANKKKTRD